jgi:hypothetical protein
MVKTIITRRVGLTVVAALATLGFAAPAASANPAGADTATCTLGVNGVAGPITPPIPPPPAGVHQDGTYAFGGSATCVVNDVDTDSAGTTVPIAIQSAGYYTNEVCGTGNVNGTAGITTTVPGNELGNGPVPAAAAGPPPTWYVPQGSATAANNGIANKFTAASYGIDFQAGVGSLGGGATLPDSDAANITGTIDITPQNAGGCVNANVSFFNVNGSFTAES